ncbi:hypothetical protein O6H91_19G020700 [Diphasiastrum complanatum]|uniref:Uncharacterized protein n=1 Tax=Diphasiastrum complanatum TaxID=34168 RepID=A0ACC2ATG4_DIPCM|nr:hypothetical protein O6H91_19G020700 [Diphasiastrum complanatum]
METPLIYHPQRISVWPFYDFHRNQRSNWEKKFYLGLGDLPSHPACCLTARWRPLLALRTVCCPPLCAARSSVCSLEGFRWRDSWQSTAVPRCLSNCSLPSSDRYRIATVCPPAIYLWFLPVHCLSANTIASGNSAHY